MYYNICDNEIRSYDYKSGDRIGFKIFLKCECKSVMNNDRMNIFRIINLSILIYMVAVAVIYSWPTNFY